MEAFLFPRSHLWHYIGVDELRWTLWSVGRLLVSVCQEVLRLTWPVKGRKRKLCFRGVVKLRSVVKRGLTWQIGEIWPQGY